MIGKRDKKVDNQVRFRAAPELLDGLLERAANDDMAEGIGDVARRDLHRYYGLVALMTPTFSEGEAKLIVMAIKGQGGTEHGARLLWAIIDEAVEQEGLAERYGVDRDALIGRLRFALNRCELLAVIDAAERAWGCLRGDHPTTIQQAVRRVGLVKDEEAPGATSLLATIAVAQ